MRLHWSSVVSATLLVSILGGAGRVIADQPVHMLFWQEIDVLDAVGVSFQAHPFPEDRFEVLVEKPADRPTLWHMPVAAIPVEGGVRIYYQRVENGLDDWTRKRTLCLGVLAETGFTRPDLGLFDQDWPGPRNVVMQRSPHTPTWGGFNVHQIVGDAESGYTMLYWDQPAEGNAGAMLAHSDDGIHWEKNPLGTVFTEHNDAYTLRRQGAGYVVYQTRLLDWPEKPYPDNIPGKRRVQTVRTSPDLVEWTPQEAILEPDDLDGEAAEFYLLKTFHHVDRYVGLLMKYYADPDTPNRHSAICPNEVVFSRDGRDWERPYRQADPGLWSYADPFELGDDLCLVSHHDGALVLARMRRDGLACVSARERGSFRTRAFALPETPLRLNADCRSGVIEVGLVVAGTEVSRCTISGADGVGLPLQWDPPLAPELSGELAELQLHLTNASVFALTSAE